MCNSDRSFSHNFIILPSMIKQNSAVKCHYVILLSVDTRSLCSLVCKWSYHADNQGNQQWNQNFYKTIGLEDLLENDAAKIGQICLMFVLHFK
jgi:hypothetical protein